MKKAFIICFLFSLSLGSHAQTITIIDQETQSPLELVTLISKIPVSFTITNPKGQAELSTFKGADHIEIRAIGYKTEIKSYEELRLANFKLALEPSALNIDEVVVSATRWKQASYDVPSKISSIRAQEVALQNPQNTADLLATSGKVFIQKSQQGGGSPMIRGFATNRLLYTVDGVRMNTAIFRSGNLQNVISLDPFSIEKTEVFFGPGSVIYGSDAIGGVMSFQTLSPQLSLTPKPLITGKALTRFSSANRENTEHFDLNLGFKKWALLTSISTNDYGDLRMGSKGPEEYLRPFYVQRQNGADVIISNDDPKIQRPSGYSQMNIMQKVLFKPADNWSFDYGFHYSETSDYSRYDRHIRYKNGQARYGEWSYGPQKWLMNNVNISHSGNHKVFDQFNLRLAQQYFEESRISRDINKPNREIRWEQVDAYSVNLDFFKTIGLRNELYYGAELVWNGITSTGIDEDIIAGTRQPGPARYPQSTWASYAVYVSDQFKISDQLLLQTGMRYNQFQLDALFDTSFYPFPYTSASMNNGALTGSIGAVYRPTKEWVLSSNISTGFRSPNIDDMGKVFDSEPGIVVVPNPDLTAEYAYNADLGIARIFGNKVKIDITGYYTLLDNALVRRDFTLNGLDSMMYDGTMSKVQALQNAALARVFGVQAGIEIKLPGDFKFSSDYNYQKGTEELDNGSTSPSRHAAPAFGISRLTYSAHKLNLQIYSVYSAGKSFEQLPEEEKGKDYLYAIDPNGNPYSPAWYTLNFKAMYQFEENLTISAGLENITDQRYRPYSSGLVAPGRNFILSLKYIF